jgi:hypothetical protein
LHRYLVSCRIEDQVVDSSSIEVNRRKRRTKTDQANVGQLVRMLMRVSEHMVFGWCHCADGSGFETPAHGLEVTTLPDTLSADVQFVLNIRESY